LLDSLLQEIQKMELILREYEEKENKRVEVRDACRDILRIKKRREDLESREKQLKEKMNQELANDDDDVDDDVDEGVPQPGDIQAKTIFNIVKTKQKLEGLAYMSGITGWKQDNDEIYFTFDPFINGHHAGTYVLRMKPSQGRMISQGHNLPHSVPLKKLHSDYLMNLSSQDRHECLKTLLKTIMRYLRAYLSREDQFQELKEGALGDNIREVQAVNHYTAIKIVLVMMETDDENSSGGSCLKVTLSMNYAKDGERPLKGSVNVVAESESQADVDTDTLLEQCQSFYTNRLKNAIVEAF